MRTSADEIDNMECGSAPRQAAKVAKLKSMIAEGDKVIAARFRTKLCRNFVEKGSCPYESRCMFAHGRHQLRTKETNLRDGLVNEDAIRQFKRALSLKARHLSRGAPFALLRAPTPHLPNAARECDIAGVRAADGLRSASTEELGSHNSPSLEELNLHAEHGISLSDSLDSLDGETPMEEGTELRGGPESALEEPLHFLTASNSPCASDKRSAANTPNGGAQWYRHDPYAWMPIPVVLKA